MNKENLYKALCYFDIFSYPLSKLESEIWQWSDSQEVSNPSMERQDGFFFLPGHSGYIKERQSRYKISDKKINRAIKIAKIFRLLPSVKMIAVCNSLGYQNANASSDIDLFVIVQPGKIWLTRFWLQGFLKLFRLRPFDRGKKENSICLTFFLSSDNLNIGNLKISQTDIYLNYWLTQLLPVYDPEGYYQKFIDANTWLVRRLPRYIPNMPSRDRQVPSVWYNRLFIWMTYVSLESYFKEVQLKIMPAKITRQANVDSRTVISDQVLKFHGDDDNRLNYLNKWQIKLAKHK